MSLLPLKALLLASRQSCRRPPPPELARTKSTGTVGIASLLRITRVSQSELPAQCRLLVAGSVSSEHLQAASSSSDVFLLTKSSAACALLSLHSHAQAQDEQRPALVAGTSAGSTELALRSSEAPLRRLLSSYSLQTGTVGSSQKGGQGGRRLGAGTGTGLAQLGATAGTALVTVQHMDAAARADCTDAPTLPGTGGSVAEHAVSAPPYPYPSPSSTRSPSSSTTALVAPFTAAQKQLYDQLYAACSSASYSHILSTLSSMKASVHVGVGRGEGEGQARGTQAQEEGREGSVGWVRPEHVQEVTRMHDPEHGATLLHVLAGATSGGAGESEESTVEQATEAVRALCASGALLDAPSANGATALHWAAGAGSVAMVQALLSAGADPLARTYTWRRQVYGKGSGQTPLHWAAESNHSAVVDLLTQLSPLALACMDERGKTARDIAVAEASMQAARRLAQAEGEAWVILQVTQVAAAMKPLNLAQTRHGGTGQQGQGQGQLT